MDIGSATRERRSIRHYTDRKPKADMIQKIIQAGIWAPSGLNNQPWKFMLIRDAEIKSQVAQCTKYGDIIRSAPVLICVFLDNGATYNREKDIMSLGACIQNMILQAHELGLGTCWLGEILNRKKDVESKLGVDSDYELMACVTLGYSGEEMTKGCRKSLKSFIIEEK